MEGAEPSSPSAEGEMLSAFLFGNFFFAPRVSKKKWAGSLMLPCGEREPSLVGTGVLDGPDVFAPHNTASVSLPQRGGRL